MEYTIAVNLLYYVFSIENSRPLHVQRYENEEAKKKYDHFGNRSAWQVSEPLMATVILYLSDVPQGGEISFPESQVRIVFLYNTSLFLLISMKFLDCDVLAAFFSFRLSTIY